eukprot:241518_1
MSPWFLFFLAFFSNINTAYEHHYSNDNEYLIQSLLTYVNELSINQETHESHQQKQFDKQMEIMEDVLTSFIDGAMHDTQALYDVVFSQLSQELTRLETEHVLDPGLNKWLEGRKCLLPICRDFYKRLLLQNALQSSKKVLYDFKKMVKSTIVDQYNKMKKVWAEESKHLIKYKPFQYSKHKKKPESLMGKVCLNGWIFKGFNLLLDNILKIAPQRLSRLIHEKIHEYLDKTAHDYFRIKVFPGQGTIEVILFRLFKKITKLFCSVMRMANDKVLEITQHGYKVRADRREAEKIPSWAKGMDEGDKAFLAVTELGEFMSGFCVDQRPQSPHQQKAKIIDSPVMNKERAEKLVKELAFGY